MSAVRALALAAVLIAAGPAGADLTRTDYDPLFQRAAARWMPGYDWRWLRAQCYQESRFDPVAVSPAGARGLCQFMPGTWADARRAIGVGSVWSPAQNTWAAGWYMRRMLAIWTAERTDYQRLQLAQASYNAGAGHIIEAQRLCSDAPTWAGIAPCLPDVTGRHARETIGYVRSIRGWFCQTVSAGAGGIDACLMTLCSRVGAENRGSGQ